MTSVQRVVVRLFSTFAVVLPLLTGSAMAAETKEWTVLVFLNGHNNLDEFGAFNINQMEKIGSTDRVNVVVQWASAAADKTKRLLVTKDTDAENVTSAAVEELPRVDMGDYKQLTEFIKWGVEKYPANHYFVDVWNHGSGWHRFDETKPVFRDISFDEFSGNHITTVQLGTAMKDAAKAINRKIDIYGSDACLMQMMEVNAELAGAVDVAIGSEEVEPGEGWPYDTFLTNVDALTDMSATNVSKALISAFYDFYHAKSADVQLSAVDLNKQDAVMNALTSVVSGLAGLTATELKAVATSADSVQTFYYSDYADLPHLVDVFQKVAPAKMSVALGTLKTALNDYVIHSQFNGALTNARGVSIWLPRSKYEYQQHEKKYDALTFAKTGWKQSVNALVVARETP